MTHTLTRGTLAAALGLSLALAWALGDSRAQVSLGTAFTYQGRLASGGAPVNNTCDFQFSLWNAASGGTQIGIMQTVTATVSAGYFTVPNLDFGANAFTGEARWLAIAVRCPAGSGSYTALSPRQALTATPYAHSLRPGAIISGTLANDSVLFVQNTAGSGFSSGVFGRSDSPDGSGVFGLASAASGTNDGVFGRSYSTDGRGVYGLASAATGTTYGVYGDSRSSSGYGVYGFASAITGTTYGVFGRSNSTAGHGMYGLAGATSGVNYGVFGRSDSTAGRGMYGWATATSGINYGVYGRSDSTVGTAMYGWASATSGTNYGLYGRSDSTVGTAMYGWASATSGTNYGVFGRSDSASGYAGYFQSPNLTSTVAVYALGNIQATGLIAGAAKAFVMDHPADPANKYLYHFAQEGPAVQNVYNGVVTLNAAGEATITLPEYFAAANTGPFLYQLTPIGAAMPNLHIAQKITGNRFRIAGGIAGMEVSWEVTATRSDPTTRSLNLAVEVDKPAGEKGTYLHPQAFGQLPEKGLDYQRSAALQQTSPESPTTGGDR